MGKRGKINKTQNSSLTGKRRNLSPFDHKMAFSAIVREEGHVMLGLWGLRKKTGFIPVKKNKFLGFNFDQQKKTAFNGNTVLYFVLFLMSSSQNS